MNKKGNTLFLISCLLWSFELYASPPPSSIKNACQAVWSVKTSLSENIEEGTGFFALGPKFFITNFHVIQRALTENRFEYIYLSQKQNPNNIKAVKGIVGLSIHPDLAILETETESPYFLNLRKSPLNQSKKLYLIGNPDSKFRIMETNGETKTYQSELVASMDRFKLEGASGGPLLDSNGRVTGVFYSHDKNISYFVSQSALKKFIEDNKDNPCKKPTEKCVDNLISRFLKKIEKEMLAEDLFALAHLFTGKEALLMTNNSEEYMDFLNRAYQQDNFSPAKFYLAMNLNKDDKEIPKDLKRANKMTEELAKEGYPGARFIWAQMLLEGKGVKKDLKKATQIIQELAEQGEPRALLKWALMLLEAKNVKQNHLKAFKFFSQLAEKEISTALFYKAKMLYDGQGVKQDYKKAFEIFDKVGKEENLLNALFYKAVMLYKGQGVKQDYEEAFEIFSELDEKEFPKILFYKGIMLYEGKGVTQNYEKASKNFKKALTHLEDSEALLQIGMIYYNGKEPFKNHELAVPFFTKSKNLGNAEAQLYLTELKQNSKKTNEIFRPLHEWEEELDIQIFSYQDE